MLNKLNRRKIRELLLFGLSGVAGFLSDFLTTFALGLIISPYLARIPAFIAATLTTWQINRRYTFKDQTKYSSLPKEYVHYVGLMLFGLIVNYLVFAFTFAKVGQHNLGLISSVAAGSLAGMIINFILSKKYIYNK